MAVATPAVEKNDADASAPRVKLGKVVYPFGQGGVGELRDSSAHRDDGAILRQRLQEDGYVFLRSVLPEDSVSKGRSLLLKHLEAEGVLDPEHAIDDAVVAGAHGGDQGRVDGMESLMRAPDFLSVVEHPALFKLFDGVFGSASTTFDFKWLRAVQPGESSGFHMDSVYMSRGSPELITCWIPLGEVPLEMGGLTVLRGSHASAGYNRIRETYGNLDLDRDDVGGTGWFTEDPEEALHFGGHFETAHFNPGDVVFFTMKTLHGSSVNLTNRWRLSVDVRFQPKNEPADSRWMLDGTGEVPGVSSRWAAHRHDTSMFPKTMEDAKREWGVHW